MKTISTILAFLISPIIAAVILTGLVGSSLGIKSSLGLFPTIYIFTFGVTLIVGLPVYLLVSRFYKFTWWTALLIGFLVGGVGSIIFVVPNEIRADDFFGTVPIGGLSAFVFWLIWRCGHSQKSA